MRLRWDIVLGELLGIGFVVFLCWLIREYQFGGVVCKASSWVILKIMVGSSMLSVILRGVGK